MNGWYQGWLLVIFHACTLCSQDGCWTSDKMAASEIEKWQGKHQPKVLPFGRKSKAISGFPLLLIFHGLKLCQMATLSCWGGWGEKCLVGHTAPQTWSSIFIQEVGHRPHVPAASSLCRPWDRGYLLQASYFQDVCKINVSFACCPRGGCCRTHMKVGPQVGFGPPQHWAWKPARRGMCFLADWGSPWRCNWISEEVLTV